MEEPENNMSTEDVGKADSPMAVKKPKKRSMVERELETSLTARVTSPAVTADAMSTSRYGRARRLKTESELIELQKTMIASIKSGNENSPAKAPPPVYRMHASNSPHKSETPKKTETYLDNQIDNIYQENMSLSRFSDETGSPSPAKKFPKVYIRKDLIQNRETEETVMLIKNLFSPTKSGTKSSDSPLGHSSDYSSEKNAPKQNGYVDNTSVVKTLDFDGNKKKKNNRDKKPILSQNNLFDLEAKCLYQVGDLAWARMGTFPFWPCIITRDPYSDMFVKKKMFGRVEHDIIHVTFFGDNGRRSWIVDNMLRKYLGQLEFEATKEKFTPEDKKKDPKLYAAFFISEKKRALWNTSVEEAETFLREPKRLRIDLFNDMLLKSRASKKNQRSGKITRTDSDVSLSESLYDSLFSEEDVKTDDVERSKNKSRNKSFDVSEVVTACLDNMAAKTGITKIQRQSHMDRWLQKAKSKTPEKTQAKLAVIPLKVEVPEKSETKLPAPIKLDRSSTKSKKKPKSVPLQKPYSLRRNNHAPSKLKLTQTVHGACENVSNDTTPNDSNSIECGFGIISNIKSLADKTDDVSQNCSTVISIDNNAQTVIKPISEPKIQDTTNIVQANSELSDIVDMVEKDASKTDAANNIIDAIIQPAEVPPAENTGNFIAVNDKISDPQKVSNMIDVENTDNIVQDKSEKSDMCETRTILAMEVDDDSNSESQANDEKSSLMTKTVSNESVEVQSNDDICNVKSDTHMKEAQNVTIEASVTETKNDDNLNTQAEGGQQERNYELKLSNQSEINENIINFLDVSNRHNLVNMVKSVETSHGTLAPQNPATPEKSMNYEEIVPTIILSNDIAYRSEKLSLDNHVSHSNEAHYFRKIENIVEKPNDIFPGYSQLPDQVIHLNEHNSKEIINEKDNIKCYMTESRKQLINKSPDIHNINDKDVSMDSENDELNKSSNSESVSQLSNEIHNPEVEECSTISDSGHTAINANTQSEYILGRDKTNFTAEENYGEIDSTIKKLENKSSFMSEENHDSSNRQLVESPTFTQLLESEEFFRDVNEPCNNVTDDVSESNEKSTECIKKINEFENDHANNAKQTSTRNFDEDCVDEDTSEDEPSPEYESFDEDFTEDFRKHMKSIEINITDKRDEEQIVKICNEIAEKAKQSPTKYNIDVERAKPIENHDPITINKLRTENEKQDENKTIDPDQEPTKKKTTIKSIDKQERSYIKSQNISNINEVDKIHIIECYVKINGDVTVKEIPDNNKTIYRTRLSLSSNTKERASPDIKLESSELQKQLRKSCEFEPKVVIMRLETDKIGLLKDADYKAKSLEDKSKSKINKPRLSLKRDSTKSKHTEVKFIEKSEPEIKLDESKCHQPASLDSKEEIVTLNKAPKKLNIENGAIETNIPESVKVNGYHNNVYRKIADTPDLLDDTDFDIDTVSLSSEDSDISLPYSVESVPKRSLRSKPERTLENALKNPEFLKYLELRQDYLLDEHSDLNEDEVVSYVYKTWQYEEDLKSNCKKVDEVHHLNLIKGLKQETATRKKSKKSQPKNNLENHFREKYEKCKKPFDFDSETGSVTSDSFEAAKTQKMPSRFPDDCRIDCTESKTDDATAKRKTRSKSPDSIDITSEGSNDILLVKDKYKDLETVSVNSLTPKRTLRSKTVTPKSLEKQFNNTKDKSTPEPKLKVEREFDTDSIGSEDSEIPLRQLRFRALNETVTNEFEKETTPEKKVDLIPEYKESLLEIEVKEEGDETASTVSDNEPLLKQKKKKGDTKSLKDPEFIKYLELRQDALMDENPQLTQDEIVSYLHKTWIYEENSKSDLKKNDELEQSNLVKGLNNEAAPIKKVRRKPKVEKKAENLEAVSKEKPRRRIVQPYYNENYSDIEDELEVFEIFKTKKAPITAVSKTEADKVKSPKSAKDVEPSKVSTKTEGVENMEEVIPEPIIEIDDEAEYVDEIELYFAELTKPKPNVFKGLMRDKVCDICELAGNLVKCKGCNGMFHPDCVKNKTEVIEIEALPSRGRKKKKKLGRKLKSLEDSESHSDEKSQDVSADLSVEDIIPPEICTFDADTFETQLALKMKELLEATDNNYDSYSSDDGIDWKNTVAGQCEIVDVKSKHRKTPIDYSDFKCHNCQRYDVPVCFVCKCAVSKTNVKMRQKCHVAHCHKYYHLECLDHWPQTQFNSGEPSRNNKKINEFFEALTCPRHVCHTCVSDDPRGCKTRFSGDKLAKCVRCPATYHSFNKCLPAGSQILTASHIICPRHSDQRSGKVPCHVNTGWCFICALGGSLICCEYCPTSFHAECLNIKPPEGNYMCEDCETGRLPLYGEMVWVKLGHYRWWPGMILHPSEIPENIMAVKHGLGDFVVRFFGQYDHYWVNRGRVFPYQEGDSGRISSQKSKIDADFTTAIEHAQRAYAILKSAVPNDEESLDIASSLLPPHYVKLKCNKPCGSLCGRKVEDPSLSLTQCECNPDEPDPCGLYSQCLNRMLLTECGPTCRAGDRCNNRAFEKRQYPKLVPYRTPHRGWGLKTLEDIKAGQFVIEYVGELIDEEEFRRRMRRKHEIRDENFYFLTLDKERMIDAGPKGNAARFMNHCCEPNCETQKWTVLGDVRVGLFAIDDIPANSEVTFNYNLQCAGIEKKRCLCGAKRCSGYIGAKPKQDESQIKKAKFGKVAGKRTYKKRKVEDSPSTNKTKPKKPLGRPPKPKELTEIEKDLLIIKNATSSISSDESSRSQSTEDKNPKMLKRKRVTITTEEVSLSNILEPSVKKQKCEEKQSEVGD